MDKALNWKQALLLNILTGLLFIATTYALTRNGQKIDKDNEVIKNLAPIPYVDAQDGKLKVEIDKKLDKETFIMYLESQKSYQQTVQKDLEIIKNHLVNNK